ncbi:MAG: CAP domain-containing protein [Clostridiales bacterium]
MKRLFLFLIIFFIVFIAFHINDYLNPKIKLSDSVETTPKHQTTPKQTTQKQTAQKQTTPKPTSTTKPTITDGSTDSDTSLALGITEDDKILLDLVNEARANVGAQELSFDMPAMEVAEIKAQNMNEKNYFDHTSPTYGSPFDMLAKFRVNYSTAGENIAAGQSDVKSAFVSWMNSEGHRENIENKSFNMVGFGIAPHPQYNICYVQIFIGR